MCIGLGGKIRTHPRSIAEELKLDSIGQVYTHLGSIETLLQGRIYGGETYAPQKATMLRSFVRRHSTRLSGDSKKRLLGLADEHMKKRSQPVFLILTLVSAEKMLVPSPFD